MSNNFPYQVITLPENVEIICIKLMLSSPITYVLLMYLPALLLSIMMVYSAFSYICIMFLINGLYLVTSNFPDTDWDTLLGNSPVSNQFCDLVFETGLNPLIDKSTHIAIW